MERSWPMIRVILAPKERLTPFDLRTQTFRVNVELSTYYHGHTRKIFLRTKKKILRTFFQNFFFKFVGQDWYQTIPSGPLVTAKMFFESKTLLDSLKK